MNLLLVGRFGHVGLAFSTSTVALVNFLLLALFMRYKLTRFGGHRLGLTVLRILLASAAMAAVGWLVNDLAEALPLGGLALKLTRVAAAISLAAATFYFCCRMLGVEEATQAYNAIAGRFSRSPRRK
jgi:peptidoglycan biosynthesis protein MviN/MurJ (putative lipid II flippase)